MHQWHSPFPLAPRSNLKLTLGIQKVNAAQLQLSRLQILRLILGHTRNFVKPSILSGSSFQFSCVQGAINNTVLQAGKGNLYSDTKNWFLPTLIKLKKSIVYLRKKSETLKSVEQWHTWQPQPNVQRNVRLGEGQVGQFLMLIPQMQLELLHPF